MFERKDVYFGPHHKGVRQERDATLKIFFLRRKIFVIKNERLGDFDVVVTGLPVTPMLE
jgi:hypothetical protein